MFLLWFYVSSLLLCHQILEELVPLFTEQLQILQDQILLHGMKCPMCWQCVKIWQIVEAIFGLPAANLAVLQWTGNYFVLAETEKATPALISALVLNDENGLGLECFMLKLHLTVKIKSLVVTSHQEESIMPWICWVWHQKPWQKLCQTGEIPF